MNGHTEPIREFLLVNTRTDDIEGLKLLITELLQCQTSVWCLVSESIVFSVNRIHLLDSDGVVCAKISKLASVWKLTYKTDLSILDCFHDHQRHRI